MSDEHPNAEPGDIIFVLQEKEHAAFKRKNNDLLVRKEVTLSEALCGYEFVLTHLDGRKIVVKSQPGEVIKPDAGMGEPFVKCVADEGMPKAGSPFEKGRLFIFFRIIFPEPRAMGAANLEALKKLLPAPSPCESYDPETSDIVHTEVVDLKDFGKKDPGDSSAYDSDEEGGGGRSGPGGVQCQ